MIEREREKACKYCYKDFCANNITREATWLDLNVSQHVDV